MTSPIRIIINGRDSNTLSVLDRAVQFGDGVFETLAVMDGVAEFLAAHLARLRQGCERLGIPVPDLVRLRKECNELLKGIPLASLKIIVTRGQGGTGYACPREPEPTVILILRPWEGRGQIQQRRARIGVASITVSRQPALAGIKHLNALEQVLASRECQKHDWDECLRLDDQGYVVEGCRTNVFMVKDGQIFTPELKLYGIAGIMRQRVIQSAREMNIQVMEQPLRLQDFHSAEEVFLTNSLVGIWSVGQLARKRYQSSDLTRCLGLAVQGH
ncbi:MAG: aminodeoxychorismate lyase [Gammaproteobacteria bacterium]|nr:MAG: aminodeoxychorismate lyase [Gammaproteobacteria bacterium]